MLIHPDKTTIVTQATCVLYNLIMDKENFLTEIHKEMETTTLRVYQEDTNRPINRRPPREAMDIREKFMKYFNSEIESVSHLV